MKLDEAWKLMTDKEKETYINLPQPVKDSIVELVWDNGELCAITPDEKEDELAEFVK